jgi:sec-independent protein translocase protein TatA
MGLSPFEIALVILVILIIFGASRIPGIMENLGKGIKSFKKGLKDDHP